MHVIKTAAQQTAPPFSMATLVVPRSTHCIERV
jgi:hypothetical protein